MMDVKPQLVPKLKALRLSGILETLEVRNRQAIDDKLSYVEFLERLSRSSTWPPASGSRERRDS